MKMKISMPQNLLVRVPLALWATVVVVVAVLYSAAILIASFGTIGFLVWSLVVALGLPLTGQALLRFVGYAKVTTVDKRRDNYYRRDPQTVTEYGHFDAVNFKKTIVIE